MLQEGDQAKPQVEGRASCGCVLSSRLRSERAQPRGLGLTAQFPSPEGPRPEASSTLRILMRGVTWPQGVHGSTQAGYRGQCWKPRAAQTRAPWEYGAIRPRPRRPPMDPKGESPQGSAAVTVCGGGDMTQPTLRPRNQAEAAREASSSCHGGLKSSTSKAAWSVAG